jgi:predicted ferric reductase
MGIPLTVRLDGPFSTCSADAITTVGPLMVAAGIGITPFMGVLDSII